MYSTIRVPLLLSFFSIILKTIALPSDSLQGVLPDSALSARDARYSAYPIQFEARDAGLLDDDDLYLGKWIIHARDAYAYPFADVQAPTRPPRSQGQRGPVSGQGSGPAGSGTGMGPGNGGGLGSGTGGGAGGPGARNGAGAGGSNRGSGMGFGGSGGSAPSKMPSACESVAIGPDGKVIPC